MAIKAIETHYKGYRFRSRLEARWAVAFDVMHISWQYEPEGVQFADGTRYLPDFWLPNIGWFEVKGLMTPVDARKIALLTDLGSDVFVASNIPELKHHSRDWRGNPCDYWTSEYSDDGIMRHLGGCTSTLDQVETAYLEVLYIDPTYQLTFEEYVAEHFIDNKDGTFSCPWGGAEESNYQFCECPTCHQIGIQWGGRCNRIKCKCEKDLRNDRQCTSDADRILNAFAAAASARFEHGETPGRAS